MSDNTITVPLNDTEMLNVENLTGLPSAKVMTKKYFKGKYHKFIGKKEVTISKMVNNYTAKRSNINKLATINPAPSKRKSVGTLLTAAATSITTKTSARISLGSSNTKAAPIKNTKTYAETSLGSPITTAAPRKSTRIAERTTERTTKKIPVIAEEASEPSLAKNSVGVICSSGVYV
jgi:hypothetical protein